MITVYLCPRGDVFVYRDAGLIASPYGTDWGAERALSRQPRFALVVQSLDEAIGTVLEHYRTEKSFGEWLNQLVRFKRQSKLAR